jgi:hypothetical protein
MEQWESDLIAKLSKPASVVKTITTDEEKDVLEGLARELTTENERLVTENERLVSKLERVAAILADAHIIHNTSNAKRLWIDGN